MLKKSFLMTTGSIIFIVGLILFPLPVPFGLPTMVIGLSIMLKASARTRRVVVSLVRKNQYSSSLWQKTRHLQRKYRKQKADNR